MPHSEIYPVHAEVPAGQKLRVELVKSPIAQTPRNRATVQALGLSKMHQVVVHDDNPSIRGMIHHVKHMLAVSVVEATAPVAETPAAEEAKPKAKRATKKAETTEETQ